MGTASSAHTEIPGNRTAHRVVPGVEGAVLVSEAVSHDSRELQASSRLHIITTASSNGQEVPTVCWKNLITSNLTSKGLSSDSVSLVMGSLRTSTHKQYSCYISKFMDFCSSSNISVSGCTEHVLINFLQSLYDNGVGYSAVNTASSAVKSFLEMAGVELGPTPVLNRFKRGIFNSRPSLPRHVTIWDPQIVLDYFCANMNNTELAYLTTKCATLFALVSYQRVSTLQSLCVSDVKVLDDKLVVHFASLMKQSRPGSHLSGLEFLRFPDKTLCIVETVSKYLSVTQPMRQSDKSLVSLFITHGKPHKNASKDTVARWIKSTLHKAGVPAEFTAHSTRSASTSADVRRGIDISAILNKAGWSRACTFHKFYNKPL